MKRLSHVCAVTLGLHAWLLCAFAQAQLRGSLTVDVTSKRSVLDDAARSGVGTILDPRVPRLAPKLELDGTMRFYGASNGQADVVQIDVTNQGALPASESKPTVGLFGYAYAGTLYQYWGGTATAANTVNGGERGFIHIEVRRGALEECRSYSLSVALPNQGTTLYGTIATQCPLRWTTPIDAARLGATPDPLIAGKTLQDIVSSRVQGSPLGLCSNCHNRDAGLPPYYRPNIARGATTLIEPFDAIGNQVGSPDGTASWAVGGTQPNGNTYYSWAEWFMSRNDKPPALKQAFAKWRADGALR